MKKWVKRKYTHGWKSRGRWKKEKEARNLAKEIIKDK